MRVLIKNIQRLGFVYSHIVEQGFHTQTQHLSLTKTLYRVVGFQKVAASSRSTERESKRKGANNLYGHIIQTGDTAERTLTHLHRQCGIVTLS